MASSRQLPCDPDGVCMMCKATPSEIEKLFCIICHVLWHASCLGIPQETVETVIMYWKCPYCIDTAGTLSDRCSVKTTKIRAIEDNDLQPMDQEEERRTDLIARHVSDIKGKAKMEEDEESLDSDITPPVYHEDIKCAICSQFPERPVKTPCGHNFCLKCFKKRMIRGKDLCPKCHARIPSKAVDNPRTNTVLQKPLEEAKVPILAKPKKIKNHRPDVAFVTERAKRAGLANASSERIFVTVPSDHFGPIMPEDDPVWNRGVVVGDRWHSRMQARQWGVHLATVSGISGQSKTGAQSVVLSGGYEDDIDNGDWFVYTGSGGRDLTGNKRTSKKQTSNQDYVNGNEALRVSCKKGYPVRVLRASKYKWSKYAPDSGYRYDGIYRIERCWRIIGSQGFIVCRYLFIRCDNDPSPWKRDKQDDLPRHLPKVSGYNEAVDICQRKRRESPSWDFDYVESCWKWMKSPPPSKTDVTSERAKTKKKRIKNELHSFSNCDLCGQPLTQPMETPCGHNFCKACLEARFKGQFSPRDRIGRGHTLHVKRDVLKCPYPECQEDISEFLSNPQVNTRFVESLEKAQHKRKMDVETSYMWNEKDIEEGDTDGGSDDDVTV